MGRPVVTISPYGILVAIKKCAVGTSTGHGHKHHYEDVGKALGTYAVEHHDIKVIDGRHPSSRLAMGRGLSPSTRLTNSREWINHYLNFVLAWWYWVTFQTSITFLANVFHCPPDIITIICRAIRKQWTLYVDLSVKHTRIQFHLYQSKQNVRLSADSHLIDNTRKWYTCDHWINLFIWIFLKLLYVCRHRSFSLHVWDLYGKSELVDTVCSRTAKNFCFVRPQHLLLWIPK